MKLRSRAPPEDQNVVKKFLFSLMEQLEQQKSKLGSKADDAQAHGVVLNWALKVFKLADDEDRSDNANKITAKNFLAASQFFEVAKQFGELNTDIQDKQKYAKWKAVDILNAIKRGEKPRPGGKDEFLFDGEQDQQQEDNVPINTSSHSSFDIDSHNNNTTTTTNVHSDYSHHQQQGNIPTIPNFTSVNFPTIPNIPHSSPSFDIPTIPTPSFNMNDTNTHHIPNSNNSTHNNVPSFPSNVPHNLTTPTPSKPSPQTPHVVSTNTISPTSVNNTNTSSSTSSLYQPNEDDVAHATKYAKFVVSALSYDDIGTAVKYLKMALSSLTGEK